MATCRCPHCNAQLKLPDSAKVVRAKCRACGHVFVIESTDIPPILAELVLISRTRRYRTLGMAVAVVLVLVAGTALSNRYWGNLKDSHSQPIATSPDSSSPHAQEESEPEKIATGPQEIGPPKKTSPVSESLGDVVAPKLPPTQTSKDAGKTTETLSTLAATNNPTRETKIRETTAPSQTPASAPSISRPTPQEVFEKLSPSVVRVLAQDINGVGLGQGSGFFVSTDGQIVTNYHVIENADRLMVLLPTNAVFFVDGILALSKEDDLAILKVESRQIPPLKLSPVTTPPIGTSIFTIGNPQGLTNTFSRGEISGLRNLECGYTAIQCTAPISPGSSGGPLLDQDGNVIGVTTFYLGRGQNLNFAIPSERVEKLLKGGLELKPIQEALGRPGKSKAESVREPSRWELDLPYEAKIDLAISADEPIRPLLEGYFRRELRKINGIKLTSDKPRWQVSIVALAEKSYEGRATAYWLSLVVFQYSAHLDPANPLLTANRGEIVKHELMMRGLNVLESGIAEAVARIEGEIIEKDRASYEWLREYSKKSQDSAKQ